MVDGWAISEGNSKAMFDFFWQRHTCVDLPRKHVGHVAYPRFLVWKHHGQVLHMPVLFVSNSLRAPALRSVDASGCLTWLAWQPATVGPLPSDLVMTTAWRWHARAFSNTRGGTSPLRTQEETCFRLVSTSLHRPNHCYVVVVGFVAVAVQAQS